MQVVHYVTASGRDIFQDWLDDLSDQRARAQILRRIDRLEFDGLRGDHRYLREGVSELRIDTGPGYRIYYGVMGDQFLEGLQNQELSVSAKSGAVPHEEATVESFRRDRSFAIKYLNDVLEDGDEREVMLALRRVAQAFGGIGEVATKADLNAKSLYRTLSAEGNPELKTLIPLLRALGMQLRVVRCKGGVGRDERI